MATSSVNIVGSVLSSSSSSEKTRRLSRVDQEGLPADPVGVDAVRGAEAQGDESAAAGLLGATGEHGDGTGGTADKDIKTNYRKRSTLLNLHRVIVEQEPEEPVPIILFKWAIILCGLAMLCAVAYYMVGCVYQSIAKEIQVMLESDREAHAQQQQQDGDLNDGVRVRHES